MPKRTGTPLTVTLSVFGALSNGGLSATETVVWLLGEGDTEIPEGAATVVWSETTRSYPVIVPSHTPEGTTPWMAGGAIVTFPDGTVAELHDRTETWEQYWALSGH